MRITHRKNRILISLLAWIFLLFPGVSIASTKVGNGGDIMAAFLEETRNTLNQVSYDVITQKKFALCEKVTRLNADEQAYCNLKLKELLPEIGLIMKARPIVPLRIQENEITVDIPGGGKRPVSAITDCGRGGPIKFHFASVKALSLASMFQLLTHEFFHKVPFEGQTCLQDLDTPGPFNEEAGGRRLIDAMAEALTLYAIGSGRLGADLGISDSFSCQIKAADSPFINRSTALSARLFSGEKTSGIYLAGVGNSPHDGECSMESANLDFSVSLKIAIKESGNCENPSNSELRSTTVRLVKSYSSSNPNVPPKAQEILKEKRLPGINPLCNWYIGDSTFSESFLHEPSGIEYAYSLEYLSSKGSQPKYLRYKKLPGPVPYVLK